MLPASTVPQSGQVLVSHHCRVSSMTYSLHLNRMIRQMVSRGLVYPLRVSRLTYTAPQQEKVGTGSIEASTCPVYIGLRIRATVSKKPEKFWLPHGMPSDDREFAFSSRVFPKASQIKALYKLWHYQSRTT